ncbi:hypothetical protein MCAP1_001097 [Malassezia caprae]|uniref:Uncharacterized protein n=1 Tax=Malassezia caprae TaxID=1381934 RepID=A0AAF0E633_9BASI|nr:hypothetical protein MCAP1_001097 [Malassezia caprae]
MPEALAAGPNAPAADPDTTATSETVSEHPLADTSGSALLDDGEGALSIPMTPSSQRPLRAGSSAPSTSHTPLEPRSVTSTPATMPRRSRQIRYIRSNASSPTVRRVPPARTDDRPRQYERIHRLVTECNNAAAGHSRNVAPLQADMLEAIATQERHCLELREELGREETLLKDMRDAWQRMALRVGVGAIGLPVHAPPRAAPRVTQRPTPPVPAAAAPARDETAWSDLRFMPSQIASQFQALVDSRPSSGAAASTPPSSRSPGKDDAPAYRVRTKRLPPIDTHAARPPALPPKDDLSADVLREKLSNGWHVLSKRLIETTSSFKDLSWMVDDMPSTAPSSRMSLPPLFSDDTDVGALSRVMSPRSPTGHEAHAPPLPPKSPTRSRPAPALATDAMVVVPSGDDEPLGEASMAGPTVSEPLTRDLVSLAIHEAPSADPSASA